MNRFKILHSLYRRFFPLLYKRTFKNVGQKSFIIKPIFINNPDCIHLGDNCEIWNGARIECIKNWSTDVFNPKITIGDNTIINQNCHITCASSVNIGNDVGISHGVTITDINHNTGDKKLAVVNQGITTTPVVIEDGVTIGANAVILGGVKIGKHAVIGANAVVKKDVPDYCIAVGVPARVIG